MRFIFRIDRYFSRVVNAILHPNDSNGSTNCAQYLSHKICKAVFLSTSNDIHFSDRQLFFSGRECHSPFERFERIDKLWTIPQPQNMQSSKFLSPSNGIHFSDRQLFFSGRKSHSPFERIDKLCTIPQPQNMQSSRFLSPTNDIHFSDRQLFFSGRKWCSPFVRFERIDNLNTMHLAKPQQMTFVLSKSH